MRLLGRSFRIGDCGVAQRCWGGRGRQGVCVWGGEVRWVCFQCIKVISVYKTKLSILSICEGLQIPLELESRALVHRTFNDPCLLFWNSPSTTRTLAAVFENNSLPAPQISPDDPSAPLVGRASQQRCSHVTGTAGRTLAHFLRRKHPAMLSVSMQSHVEVSCCAEEM